MVKTRQRRQWDAMMGQLIDEASQGGAYVYRATVVLPEDMLPILDKLIEDRANELTVIEKALVIGVRDMREAMLKGQGPMCGCCDHVFVADGPPPEAFVLVQAESPNATIGSFAAVCTPCTDKSDMVLQVVRAIQPDARIVSNTVGHC